MNKKLIALALVLLIAVGGLFAVGLPLTGKPEATLTGTVGPIFLHGLIVNDEYTGANTYSGAFGGSGVSFKYGFETNYGAYQINMTISDFEQDSGTGVVKIASVSASGMTLPDPDSSGKYVLFSSSSNSFTRDSTTITVVAAGSESLVGTNDHKGVAIEEEQVYATAPNGNYTATVKFEATAT